MCLQKRCSLLCRVKIQSLMKIYRVGLFKKMVQEKNRMDWFKYTYLLIRMLLTNRQQTQIFLLSF